MRGSYETNTMRVPGQATRWLPVNLDFTASALVAIDLTPEMSNGIIDLPQSMFIDNSQNAGALNVSFPGIIDQSSLVNRPYTIIVQAFFQGWFPIPGSQGPLQFVVTGGNGLVIPVHITNVPMPYFASGPNPGTQVIPAMVNAAIDLEPAGAGDNFVVAAVGGQSVKLYRGMVTVGAATNLKIYSGPAANNHLLAAYQLGPLGSVTFQVSGVPWATTNVGDGLNFNLSAGANLMGQIGYAQF